MLGRSFTIRTAARLLDEGLITSEQLVSFCHKLAVAGEEIWGLNAYSCIAARDEIIEKARESDLRRKHGEALSLIDGLPVSIKCNLAVKNLPLTAGSRILGEDENNTPPCGYDADVVKTLIQEAGGINVGTTRMDEFGMGSLGLTCNSKPTKNPLPYMKNISLELDMNNKENVLKIIQFSQEKIYEIHEHAYDKDEPVYSAGGSSCGSAASVAHGSAIMSLGSDTGGSVRLPSAWCGIVGLKPTYGALSRHGLVSYASSFDTVGILANSVDCASYGMHLLRRKEETSRDSTSSSHFSPNERDSVSGSDSLSGIVVGIPASFSVKECPTQLREAWLRSAELLQQGGASIQEIATTDISVDLIKNSLAAYYILVSAEASSNLSRYDGFRYGVMSSDDHNFQMDAALTALEKQYSASRVKGFGTEVSRRVLCGASVLSSDRFHTHYEAAAKLRAALAHQMHSVLNEKVDMLLIPTALSFPHRIDQVKVNSTEMFSNDVMTIPTSLAGLPSVALPVKEVSEISFPGSVQLIGARFTENQILAAANFLEETNKL